MPVTEIHRSTHPICLVSSKNLGGDGEGGFQEGMESLEMARGTIRVGRCEGAIHTADGSHHYR